MPAATIVFTDVVKFSEKHTEEQKRLIEALNAEVIHEIRPLLSPPYESPQVIALPTGDGMALVFMHCEFKKWTRETIFCLIYRLQKWAKQESSDLASVALTFGIHTGSVELVTDVNGNPNICGDTINYTQRVMSEAVDRQVFLSEVAYRELIGDETKKCHKPFGAYFGDDSGKPVYRTVKHSKRIPIYAMRLCGKQEFWNNDEPRSSSILSLLHTTMPKSADTQFREQRRREATHIAFVQLTGAGFLNEYREQEQNQEQEKALLSADLERFWVFMPTSEAYDRMDGSKIAGTDKSLDEYIEEWKSLLAQLNEKHPKAEFKLSLCETIGYYASYLDWEQKGGFIHISPSIWGVAAADSPGFDMMWEEDEEPQLYKAYREGLYNLNAVAPIEFDSSRSTG